MKMPKTMKLDDVDYVRADSIPQIKLPVGDYAPWELGEEYFIQTVTHYYLGQLVAVHETELVLTSASWVAATGRFNQFIKGSRPTENEPYNKNDIVILGRGALISATKRKICLELV
jgi:hypothetical protein